MIPNTDIVEYLLMHTETLHEFAVTCLQ